MLHVLQAPYLHWRYLLTYACLKPKFSDVIFNGMLARQNSIRSGFHECTYNDTVMNCSIGTYMCYVSQVGGVTGLSSANTLERSATQMALLLDG